MDPDLLRLFLLFLGVLLVVGIYLWDRYKRATPAPRNRRIARPAERSEVVDDDLDEAAIRSAPEVADEPAVPDLPNEGSAPSAVTDDAAENPLDPEPENIGDWSASTADEEPQLSMSLNFGAHGDGDYLHADPALDSEVERKLLVIHLVARNGAFSGPAIDKACHAVQLELGERSIFHRHDGAGGPVLFSMASMVEPGTFTAAEMATFSTPGLSLFTQLPGARDGVQIYDVMLSAADEIAALLHAEVQDAQHNKLTRQMREHMRESIIEHRRRVNLARSRH